MKLVDFRIQVVPGGISGDGPDLFSGYVTIQNSDERLVTVRLLPAEAMVLKGSLNKPLLEFVNRAGVVPT